MSHCHTSFQLLYTQVAALLLYITSIPSLEMQRDAEVPKRHPTVEVPAQTVAVQTP